MHINPIALFYKEVSFPEYKNICLFKMEDKRTTEIVEICRKKDNDYIEMKKEQEKRKLKEMSKSVSVNITQEKQKKEKKDMKEEVEIDKKDENNGKVSDANNMKPSKQVISKNNGDNDPTEKENSDNLNNQNKLKGKSNNTNENGEIKDKKDKVLREERKKEDLGEEIKEEVANDKKREIPKNEDAYGTDKTKQYKEQKATNVNVQNGNKSIETKIPKDEEYYAHYKYIPKDQEIYRTTEERENGFVTGQVTPKGQQPKKQETNDNKKETNNHNKVKEEHLSGFVISAVQ